MKENEATKFSNVAVCRLTSNQEKANGYMGVQVPSATPHSRAFEKDAKELRMFGSVV